MDGGDNGLPESGNEIRVFGPPGTGKTTFIANSVKEQRTTRIAIASFTRTAAKEIAGRDLPIDSGQVGTLHALAYRSIGRPPIAQEQLDDWNKTNPSLALTMARDDPSEVTPEGGTGSTNADGMMAEIDSLRARMRPVDTWRPLLRNLYQRWCTWMAKEDLIDFSGMIERALVETDEAPGSPRIFYVDECQDLTLLELSLVRKWGQAAEKLVISGDDDQCHPAGTPILTIRDGYVPIEELKEGHHRLVSMDRNGGAWVRGGEGYGWQRSVRPFTGSLLKFRVGCGEVEVTPDHRMLVRWSERAVKQYCVYLMQRGNWWRVGMSRLLRANGPRGNASMFGPGYRARQEGADKLWILGVHETTQSARMQEADVSVYYGLSQMLFEPTNGSVAETSDMHAHHEKMSLVSFGRAIACLKDFGLDLLLPVWDCETSHTQRGGTALMTVRALNVANIIRSMTMATSRGLSRRVGFEAIEECTQREVEMEPVYSLNVEPYHHYVVHEIVVPNCIYNFRGTTATTFLNPPVPDDQKKVLGQSYRVPRAVHAVATAWVEQLTQREPKVYLPRDADGLVRRAKHTWRSPETLVDDVSEQAESGRSVMILASCAYMLDPIIARMSEVGLPYGNRFRPNRPTWNPLAPRRGVSSAEKLMSYLIMDERIYGEASRLWTGGDVRRWTSCVKKTGVFMRGVGDDISDLPDRELTYEEVARLFVDEEALERAVTPDLDWFESHLLAGSKKSLAYPINIVRRDPLLLTQEPLVTVGTIHSVKGGEAACTFMMPDISLAGMREWSAGGVQRDAIIRQFYVAMTRASEELVICAPSNAMTVDPNLLIKGHL